MINCEILTNLPLPSLPKFTQIVVPYIKVARRPNFYNKEQYIVFIILSLLRNK